MSAEELTQEELDDAEVMVTFATFEDAYKRAERAEAELAQAREHLAKMIDWHERGDMDASMSNALRFREAIDAARAFLGES